MKDSSCSNSSCKTATESLSDYDYHLPTELIAQHPVLKRDHSRLMHISKNNGTIEHRKFSDIVELLHEGDLLVVNNTKVIPARLIGKKASGGRVEVFLSRRIKDDLWEAMLKMSSGKAKENMEIFLEGGKVVLKERVDDYLWLVNLVTDSNIIDWLEKVGGIPLPPYIKRESINDNREEDKKRYQTVYASEPGAVAAPTAGLHFTDEILAQLNKKNVRRAFVTLHVGLGTFQPVREEDLTKVELHTENYRISNETLSLIDETRKNGKRVVAVGTTSVRVLEHLAHSEKWFEHEGETKLFLKPGSSFKVVDAIITNFHLPKSSLLMLVAAFASKPLVDKAYETAVNERYRFYSYGDAMFIE